MPCVRKTEGISHVINLHLFQFWTYVSDDEADIFKAAIINGKWNRKPKIRID
jgi:hypothetical protein